jgi:hypothetical protein
MVYNKADFKKHIETIQLDGFKIKNAVQAYLFIRKLDDRIETITISYKDYSPHGFYISGVSANVFYPSIEAILEEYGLGEEYKTTISKSFQDIEGINYELLSTEINSDESFGIVKKVVEEIIEKGALTFLNSFFDLESIAGFLADKKPIEIVPYIQGSILYPKTALILKLANHHAFQKRLLESKNVLQENIDANKRYPILLEKFVKLFASDLEVSL